MSERGGNGVTRRAKLKGLKMMRGQCLKLRFFSDDGSFRF
jgi:hypothetical protein